MFARTATPGVTPAIPVGTGLARTLAKTENGYNRWVSILLRRRVHQTDVKPHICSERGSRSDNEQDMFMRRHGIRSR